MSKDPQQVPTAADVIGKGIDAARAQRPSIEPHLDTGRWGHVIAGWRGQFEVVRARLSSEVMASRLPTARGEALTDLCSSEFDTPREGERFSVGELTLVRPVYHFAATTSGAGGPISVVDSTTEGTAQVLITALRDALTAHFASVYSSGTGLGAHLAADTTTPVTFNAFTGTMTNLVGNAVFMMQAVTWHMTMEFGSGWHQDALPDPDIPEPFVDFPVTNSYAGATDASKASLHKCLNTAKAVFNAHVLLESRAGTVRTGHRFNVEADAAAVPAVLEASYAVTRDTPIATGIKSVTVRLQATQAGPHANLPFPTPAAGETTAYTVQSPDALFDAALVPTVIRAAGGSLGQADTTLARAGAAMWSGRHGPTAGALLAGTLSGHGASRAVTREDYATGSSILYAVDESWCQSSEWQLLVLQDLYDPDGWQGYGPRVVAAAVSNQKIRVEATVVLRDANDLSATERITTKIVSAVRAYFDDRPDWYTWRLESLRAVITKCDRRIHKCSLATVRDENNVPLSEPAALTSQSGAVALTHFYLLDNPVTLTFAAQT